MDPITIIVADDHPLFRKGLEETLMRIQPSFTIFTAANGIEVVEILHRESVQLIFMDIRMPVRDGIETTRCIRKFNSTVKIVCVSMVDDRLTVMKMFKAGANGFLHKNTHFDELQKVMEIVLTGGFYLSPEIADYENDIIGNGHMMPGHIDSHSFLTEREIEILHLICQQFSSKEIGQKLNLTEKTIETHRVHLMLKTQSKNVVGLIMYAIEKGYFLPEHRKRI